MKRERFCFDAGWRFYLGDIPFPPSVTPGNNYGWNWGKSGGFQGAAHPEFDDANWRELDLPHDWVVEGTVSPEANESHGYLPTGVGWYRKTFYLPAADAGRRLRLVFDGVFRNCTVYLNGHRLGGELSGYIPFAFDITDQALYDDDNVLAVRVDATETEGWWYEGAGIYRHVWLEKTASVHVAPEGLFVSAEVQTVAGLPQGPAMLKVQTTIVNDEETPVAGVLTLCVLDTAGKTVGRKRARFAAAAGETTELAATLRVAKPKLWSVEAPYLYQVQATVTCADRIVDETATAFGIRTLRFDPDRGFFLNDLPVKLKGASNHQDHAGVGVAVPDAIHEFRVRRFKEMGGNAWRCAHNPPAPAFLEACDRLGLLVMDETRCMNSTTDGLRQLEAMLRRDRNHPSVILWSLGNEEPHQGTANGARIIRSMKRLVRRLDPTRPVTLAMNGGWGAPVSPLLDVQGCNYSLKGYDDFHRQFPHLPVLGSETAAAVGTRGEYANDAAAGHFSAYDENKPEFGATAEIAWRAIAEREFMAGTFPWTGFDYRGEPGPITWPCVSSNFGIIDLCGFPKDSFYYYQAWWTDRPVLHLFPHWNWPGRDGTPIRVWCHSNCDRIELFLNGQSLGVQEMPRNGHLEWSVPYAPGTLCARGWRNGELATERKVETAGAPAQLVLLPDHLTLRADGADTVPVTVAVLDAAERMVPDAATRVRFRVTGPGRLLGVGNGDPASHESDKVPFRRAFHGLCMALVQTTRAAGEIVLEAEADGVLPARCVLRSDAGVAVPFLPGINAAHRLDLFHIAKVCTRPGAESCPPDWRGAEFDDQGWTAVTFVTKPALPSPSYLRFRFAAPAGMPCPDLVADLGTIHDFDETWLNGVQIGTTTPENTDPETAWRTRRVYAIPDHLLHAGGDNILAVRCWNRRTDANARTIVQGPFRIRPAAR